MAKNATGFSDPELIYLYRCGNYKAIEILKNKHGGAINDIASKLLSVCYNLNFEDVIQELNYAFLKAVEQGSVLEMVRTGSCGIGRGERILRL